jgi:multiple sugar transport system ATP-binding protein
MTVAENMGFGLKLHKVPKPEIRERVAAAAKMLGLEELLARKPAQLSGGQRQRVAMGRAIVREPAAFLMDEPLSNLDAKLRVEMRSYLADLHQKLRTTTLYVTHDQTEAMTMGDRVAVMRDGVLQQVDTPHALYERPANLFVAGFIGSPAMNLVPGRLSESMSVPLGGEELRLPESLLSRRPGLRRHAGSEVVVGIRPEDIEDAAFVPSSNGNVLDVRVSRAEPLGAEVIAHFALGGLAGTARLNPRSRAATGEPLRVAIDLDRLHFFEPQSGAAIY